MGTAAAISRRRQTGSVYDTVVATLLKPEIEFEKNGQARPHQGARLEVPWSLIGEHPELSLIELCRFNMWDEAHETWFGFFKWPGLELSNVLVSVFMPAEGRCFATIRLNYDRGPPFLIVEITTGAQKNPKHYFVCPVTGRRVDKLYFREGRFASATAQRLVHASQRARR
jgi:hypothetical protein